MTIEVMVAQYGAPAHAAAVRELVDLYAREPFGAGAALSEQVLAALVPGLLAVPGAFSLLAAADGSFVGLANCFAGFSTFAAAPLVNVHDVYVRPEWRGRGIAALLLEGAERRALARGCRMLTLEVADDNAIAQSAYRRAGFTCVGQAFWKKRLPE